MEGQEMTLQELKKLAEMATYYPKDINEEWSNRLITRDNFDCFEMSCDSTTVLDLITRVEKLSEELAWVSENLSRGNFLHVNGSEADEAHRESIQKALAQYGADKELV